MLQNMGMVSTTTCRMVEFMNDFGFWPNTPGFFQKSWCVQQNQTQTLKKQQHTFLFVMHFFNNLPIK